MRSALVDQAKDFVDLPATKTDAEQIIKMGKMLGIKDENIKQFNKSSKKELNEYIRALTKEYRELKKSVERVFLLVYCSGHGVTSNCKQVYVLNQSSNVTFNIELKLRDMAEKEEFKNFCHIFAIYDICQSDIERMP